MKKLIFSILVIFTFLIPINAFAEEVNEESVIKIGENGEYGQIYGSERNPDQGDNSKWLTIKPGEVGIRIVGEDNKEIVNIDKYGGIYLNGDVYMQNKKIDPSASNKANGFMYLLIICSLLCNLYLLISKNKNRNN